MYSCKQVHCKLSGLSIHFSSILMFATFKRASNSTRGKVESGESFNCGNEVVCKCISCQLLENSLVMFEWVIESFLSKMDHFIHFLILLYTSSI